MEHRGSSLRYIHRACGVQSATAKSEWTWLWRACTSQSFRLREDLGITRITSKCLLTHWYVKQEDIIAREQIVAKGRRALNRLTVTFGGSLARNAISLDETGWYSSFVEQQPKRVRCAKHRPSYLVSRVRRFLSQPIVHRRSFRVFNWSPIL